jgi:diacylglycerol O-acyltransferase / wax synthase
MRRAGGIDSAFLALETHDHPLHVMAVMILDPSTVPDGFSFERLREFVADRLGGIPPFRQKLVPVPLGVGRPRWVDVVVDVHDHVHKVTLEAAASPISLASPPIWSPCPSTVTCRYGACTWSKDSITARSRWSRRCTTR